MATKTFNPKRIGGGTISLEYNATTGQYSLKETGFDAVNELTIPDFSKITTTTPAKTEDPKTATDLTGTGVAQQTQQAFKIGDRDDDKGDIKRATIDKTTGDSLIQKAKDTSAALNLVDAEDEDLQIDGTDLLAAPLADRFYGFFADAHQDYGRNYYLDFRLRM